MNGWLERLERVAGAAAIVAVFGYMSLRAHFNHLGVPAAVSLGSERYLMETYSFVWNTVSVLIGILAVGAVPAVLLGWLAGRDAVRRHAGRLRLRRWTPYAAFVLLLVWIMVLAGRLFRTSDVAAGVLDPEKLQTPQSYWYAAALLSGVLAAAFLAWSRPDPADAPATGETPLRRWVWWSNAAATAVLILLLPIIHGILVQRTGFPVARATLQASRQPLCGLLVLRTDGQVVLWRAIQKKGVFTVLRTDTLTQLDTGPVRDLIAMAARAAGGQARPECSEDLP